MHKGTPDRFSDRPECPDCDSRVNYDSLRREGPPYAVRSRCETTRVRRCWHCGNEWEASEDSHEWSMGLEHDQ